MISYAQNFEDVVLARAFSSRASGFYVDVGAMDPTFHSITRHFYDNGWRGINIEPNPEFYLKLLAERPRDLNLHCGVSDEAGIRSFVAFQHEGLSSFDEGVKDRFPQYSSSRITVPTCRLSDIAALCDEPVQFLKIDVEGWEPHVLASADFRVWRPEVILVESIDSLTHKPNWDSWEPGLLATGYRFVYYDGLNRYFVREESAELISYFNVPPNIFDGFQLADMLQLQADLDRTRKQLDELGKLPGAAAIADSPDSEDLMNVEPAISARLGAVEIALSRFEETLRQQVSGSPAADQTGTSHLTDQSQELTQLRQTLVALESDQVRVLAELAGLQTFSNASQAENTVLREQLSATASDLATARRLADAVQLECIALKADLDKVRAGLAAASAFSEGSHADNNSLREQLSSARALSESLEAEAQQLKAELVEQVACLAATQSDRERLRSTLELVSAERATALQQLEAQSTETHSVAATLQETRLEATALRTSLDEVSAEGNALLDRITATEAEIAAQRVALETTASQLTGQTNLHQEALAEAAALQGRLSETQTSLGEVTATLAQTEARFAESQASLARSEAVVEDLTSQLTFVRAELAGKAAELALRASEIADEREVKVETQVMLTLHEKSIQDLSHELTAQRAHGTRQEQERDAMRRDVDDLKRLLAEAEEKYMNERLWVGQLCQERAAERATLAQLEVEAGQLPWYRAHTARLESELKAFASSAG